MAAAGVAQACGGKIAADQHGELDGGAHVTTPPGCQPVLGVEARLSAAESACVGGSGYCTATDSVECFGAPELASRVRDCASPLVPGTCPASNDISLATACTAVVGEADFIGMTCCYPVKRLSCAVPGRPLRLNGAVVLPEVIAGPLLPKTEDFGLEPSVRRALAELWCEGARYEHASVASFARLTLQLMALGAGAELVAATQAAALDEIEHARLCFALASRFSGRELRAGRLSSDGALANVDLAELAVETVFGGCVGETVAALTAVEQLAVATDPEVRAALETIAADEARHAELAWRIAAWACEVGGPAVRAQIVSAFAAALEGRSAGLAMELPGAGVMEGLGLMAPAKERAIRDRILNDVVAPCARALLAA